MTEQLRTYNGIDGIIKIPDSFDPYSQAEIKMQQWESLRRYKEFLLDFRFPYQTFAGKCTRNTIFVYAPIRK